MRSKPVIPRELAVRDVDAAVQYYVREGGTDVALRFIEALERAYLHIAHHPATGSSRYAHELDLPGLRVWPLKDYPYLIFYLEQKDHIDVWRVLHGQRDIPSWMQEGFSL